MSDIEDDPPSVLLPCTICSRTFRPEVLERHVKVCEKTSSKKRRVFDSFKSRVSGTELEEFLGPAPLPGQAPRRPSKSPIKKRTASKWKETHENLIATLRAARGVEPPPDAVMEVSKPAGNEQCPSCGRYFGPRAFDRHVEFCKEKTSRIKLTPSKVSQAQERLEARTKYRAPLSTKPKLTTKEKYSPMLARKESSESCSVSTTSAKTSPPIPTVSRNLKAGKQNLNSFSRQSPIRSSERQRSVSPTKKNAVSSSKSNCVKREAQTKSPGQPKIKENLKSPDDLRPKTGIKTSTQEKIRSSNPKLSQLEDETHKLLKKIKKNTQEKITPETSRPSYIESSCRIDEIESRCSKEARSKKITAECVNKTKRESTKKERVTDETEKVILDLPDIEKCQTNTKDEVKSGRKNKQEKLQINDLSVNDESYGIFVAKCTVRPPSSSASRTSLKTVKESVKKKKSNKIEEKKMTGRHSAQITAAQEIYNDLENKAPEYLIKTDDGKTVKIDKISKIPKPKSEFPKGIETNNTKDLETNKMEFKMIQVTTENDGCDEMKIKKKSKKWRNINEIPTDELANLSKDFELPTVDGELKNTTEELNESSIWEIAGEQFLKSDEPNQSTSAFSVDSLNGNEEKNNLEPEIAYEKTSPREDDLIVLHVTDPAKLLENEADMKLSVSEPCFPHSSTIQKLKKNPSESKVVDIIVFTASPGQIQSKIICRKRERPRKTKKLTRLELSYIREKTFLASDIPKTKRRKMCQKNTLTSLMDLTDFQLPVSSKEELEEKKKKFLEELNNQNEKVSELQITSNFHIRFMEEFQESLGIDLKEFKTDNLKKTCEKRRTAKMNEKESKIGSKSGQNFEYFEINLTDDSDVNKVEFCEPETKNPIETVKTQEKMSESNVPFKASTYIKENNNIITKKFDYFEISNDISVNKPIHMKGTKSQIKERFTKEHQKLEIVLKEEAEKYSNLEIMSESNQVLSRQNSSLEDIEEVDETVDSGNEKDIEIEHFILSKPNIQKILSKEENCLDELFPKSRKIAGELTSVTSTMAVQLGFSADSFYDLKSNEGKKISQVCCMGSSTRILQKRVKKESQLPQILGKSREQKENSITSLIEVWKNKKGSLESEKIYKEKLKLPTGKLPPLTNNNTLQIAVLPGVLKKSLSEIVLERLLNGPDSNDSYDPFKQAERQMLALLSWPSTADIKTAKNLSPSPKSKPNFQQISNLKTSPTSAFTKYPNKDEKSAKNDKTNARKSLNETFAVNESTKNNSLKEKPTYSAPDDWEQIFEKHFDLNRNEMTEQMTISVKSALDGLIKSTMKNKSNLTVDDLSPQKSKNELTQNSIITEVLYTSTPKRNSKSDKSSKPQSLDSTINSDQTTNTYRKNSNFAYGRITPPDDFSDPLGKAKKNDKVNRNSGISLSSLSFCSQISDTTLADDEVMRSNLEIIGKAAAAAAARSPRRKYARSQSVFDERNKMLFAKTYDPNCSSSDENEVEVLPKIIEKQGKSPSRNPNPKSSPSHFYRSQSVMDSKIRGDGDHSEDGDHVSSPESNRNRKAKLSGDSAYSSLNRRSPRQNIQRTQQEDRLSSSGSEHSLPAINDCDTKAKSPGRGSSSSPKKDQRVKMSKFCHECGSKYPLAIAKFCCECGVRRLII